MFSIALGEALKDLKIKIWQLIYIQQNKKSYQFEKYYLFSL